MRLPRIAAIALLGTAATAASAANAFADDCHHPRVGHIKATPKVVWSGHNVKLSTKSCGREVDSAKATVRISGVRHTVWLKHHNHWGLSGWLHVPSTARTQQVAVWGHCDDGGRALKGSFHGRSTRSRSCTSAAGPGATRRPTTGATRRATTTTAGAAASGPTPTG